jgi:phytoene dehydrogenase-like protein
MMQGAQHDVVVLGSGVGGLMAAAHLVLAGRRPLLLESDERLGGRFSTIFRDGFAIPTGAIAIPAEGPFHETLLKLGVDSQLRIPDPSVRVRIKGREVTAGGPAWKLLAKSVTKAAPTVFADLRKGEVGDDGDDLTLEQWVMKRTHNRTVLTLIQSICASTFTVNSDELSARSFFLNLRETGAFKLYGFAPRGNIVIANAIADAVRDRGGEVRTGWTGTAIEIDKGRATAVYATDPDGREHRIATTAVVSNIGPPNTARLLAGTEVADAFAERVQGIEPGAMLTVSFAATKELMPKAPGLVEYTDTDRLCMIGNMTALCPDLAPPGHTLYEAMSVPRPGLGEAFDANHEFKLLEDDLAKHVPGYDKTTVVHRKVMAGPISPATRCRPGTDPDVRTPVPNLVEVGDGVKPDGWTGTGACALTAQRAVSALLADLEATVPGVGATA